MQSFCEGHIHEEHLAIAGVPDNLYDAAGYHHIISSRNAMLAVKKQSEVFDLLVGKVNERSLCAHRDSKGARYFIFRQLMSPEPSWLDSPQP